MRIDDLNRAPLAQETGGTQASDKSGAADKAQGPRKDSTDGSSVGGSAGADHADVSRLAQSLSGIDPGRPDPSRLEQLRLQVESGSYEVSAQSVANALIEAHLGTGSPS